MHRPTFLSWPAGRLARGKRRILCLEPRRRQPAVGAGPSPSVFGDRPIANRWNPAAGAAVVALGVCVLALAAAPAAFAAGGVTGTTVCTGQIGGGTFGGAVTITTNLTVPQGADCSLLGVTVDGNVSVGQGASFSVANQVNALDQEFPSLIKGTFESEGAVLVAFFATQVDGNARIDGTSGSGGGCPQGGSVTVCIDGSGFSRNLTITGTSPGTVEFTGSPIAGNLSCSGNAAIVNNGVPEFVLGSASGQCAGL